MEIQQTKTEKEIFDKVPLQLYLEDKIKHEIQINKIHRKGWRKMWKYFRAVNDAHLFDLNHAHNKINEVLGNTVSPDKFYGLEQKVDSNKEAMLLMSSTNKEVIGELKDSLLLAIGNMTETLSTRIGAIEAAGLTDKGAESVAQKAADQKNADFRAIKNGVMIFVITALLIAIMAAYKTFIAK